MKRAARLVHRARRPRRRWMTVAEFNASLARWKQIRAMDDVEFFQMLNGYDHESAGSGTEAGS